MRMAFLLATVAALALSQPHPCAAQIKPAEDAPQPLSPEESAKRIRLPEGFRIELVASEPIVKEPSCVAFDARGRMFVCELHGYNVEGHIDTQELNKTGELDTKVRRIRWELEGGEIAEEAARRQFGVLKMLSDTDGDGVMDKADVWADDLPPCYGVLPTRGGVIVTCAPHIMFFADRDGDGRPEVRQQLLTGFNIRVLERGINNPRWGLDNWIYIGSGGDGGEITGPNLKHPITLGSSDFRIKADGSAIEPVNGRVSTFGLTINDVGDRFPSTGGRPAIYALPLPYAYLARNPHVATPATNHTAADYNRGFRISEPHPWRVKRGEDPAWVKFYGERETTSIYFSGGCSTTFYGDTFFPEEFHGDLFFCEPSLNIVHRTKLRRDGSGGYIAERAANELESEFLASTDQWFRPMNLRIGPDSALYIVDMYREIIEDYSAIPRFLQQQYGMDKGKDRGRIWRLVPENKALRTVPDFSRMTAAELARVLNDSNPWRRKTAQQLLVERGDDAIAAVDILTEQIRAAGLPAQTVLHSLYALEGLGKLTAEDAVVAIRHPDYRVRIHGLRLAESWLSTDASPRSAVFEMTGDRDPSVRLQLAMTLGAIESPEATEALLKLARKNGKHRWMDTAILSSANNAHGGRLLLALLELESPEERANAQALLEPLATTVGARRDVRVMTDALSTIGEADQAMQKAVLNGLVEGVARGDAPVPASDDGWVSVLRFLQSESAEIRELATNLAAHVPMAKNDELAVLMATAATNASNANESIEKRAQAVRLLANASYDTLAPVAAALLDARHPPLLQRAAIAALGASSDPRVGGVLLEDWPSLSPSIRTVVLDTIFARANRLPALLDAIESGMVHPSDISPVQREQLGAEHAGLFENTAASAQLQERIGRYQKALTESEPDLKRGEEIYAKACIVCHQLGDKGNPVGPALGSIITKPDEAILLDILDPNGKIDPEFKLYLVTTNDEESYAGVLASESPTSLTLRRADGGSDIILRSEIATLTASEVSLMPANLHEAISPRDAASLIAYIRKAFGEEDQKEAD